MANIRDVAGASRVSVATVSRVFNDNPRVAEETRRRVLAAAARLGYWPNAIARSLITARTHAIGVVLPDLHGQFFSELIRGIDSAARQRRLHLLVSSFSPTDEDLTSALRTVRGRIDGLIVMAPDQNASSALRQSRGATPTVLINPEAEVPGCDSISIANFDGAYAMVRHLLTLGHKRIATIAGSERNIDGRERLDGYRAALEVRGNFTERSGYEAAIELLERKSRPSAVFVANDHMAVGAIGALQDNGVRVPQDVAVTGFDDVPMARYLTPTLTSVHVDILELGRRALRLVLDRDGENGGARHEVIPTTLVVRSSCGSTPPRRSGGTHQRWERRSAVSSASRRSPGK
jgi:LacI family transcriptional regulator